MPTDSTPSFNDSYPININYYTTNDPTTNDLIKAFRNDLVAGLITFFTGLKGWIDDIFIRLDGLINNTSDIALDVTTVAENQVQMEQSMTKHQEAVMRYLISIQQGSDYTAMMQLNNHMKEMRRAMEKMKDEAIETKKLVRALISIVERSEEKMKNEVKETKKLVEALAPTAQVSGGNPNKNGYGEGHSKKRRIVSYESSFTLD